MIELTRADLIDVANGAGFMGSGGGGPLTTGLQLIDSLPEGVCIEVVGVSEVEPGKLTAISADMGSPDAMLKVRKPTALVASFRQQITYQQQAAGGAIAYAIPVEVGGENTIAPLAVAAELGLKVVDGDGAGRAVPSLTQTTFYAAEVSPYPSILASQQGQAISILVHRTEEVETLARPILQAGFDEQAGLAMWAMDPATLARATPIQGNIGVAREVGELLRTAESPVEAVCDFFRRRGRGGFLMHSGILGRPDETTGGGFDVGHVAIAGADGTTVTVYNQNENLIAWSDRSASPIAMAPDSICYLTAGGQPFSNADIEPMDLVGQEVSLIGLIADPALRASGRVMASFRNALIALGYSGPYVPIEEIWGNRPREAR